MFYRKRVCYNCHGHAFYVNCFITLVTTPPLREFLRQWDILWFYLCLKGGLGARRRAIFIFQIRLFFCVGLERPLLVDYKKHNFLNFYPPLPWRQSKMAAKLSIFKGVRIRDRIRLNNSVCAKMFLKACSKKLHSDFLLCQLNYFLQCFKIGTP